MNFLVTGGAGFIGHNVVGQLEAAGHKCHIVDSATNYGFIPIDELTYLHHERNKRMRAIVHHVDITNRKELNALFLNFKFEIDAVIHLASFPRQKVVADNPVTASEVMSTALINLLELTVKYHIPKFVYISSSMVYGNFKDGVGEMALCNPIGQYGIMKYMGEKLVQDYSRRKKLDSVIVRPSAVYGELDVEDRVMSKFLLAALRNETLYVRGIDEKLDFTHVDDTAHGIVLAATLPNAINKIYNITRGQAHSLLAAAEMAVKICNKGKIEIVDRDTEFPSRGALDITWAQSNLKFHPLIDLADGMTRYMHWFKKSTYWRDKIVER